MNAVTACSDHATDLSQFMDKLGRGTNHPLVGEVVPSQHWVVCGNVAVLPPEKCPARARFQFAGCPDLSSQALKVDSWLVSGPTNLVSVAHLRRPRTAVRGLPVNPSRWNRAVLCEAQGSRLGAPVIKRQKFSPAGADVGQNFASRSSVARGRRRLDPRGSIRPAAAAPTHSFIHSHFRDPYSNLSQSL
jgi:hypothetical protein